MFVMVRDCFRFRDLIRELVSRDIKVRYRRSVLGMLWTLLTPILTMFVMTIVFSKLFRFEIENYVVYLLAGNILFSFFSDTTNSSVWCIVENAGLIKKVYVPKCIFPVTKTFSNIVNLGFALAALIIVMLVTGTHFYWTALLFFVPILYLTMFTMGLSCILATMTVFFRDISHMFTVISLLWMYATPIFYPAELLAENAPIVLTVNPMYHYIDYFRELVLYGRVPGLYENTYCFLTGLVMLLLGLLVLSRRQNRFILYI